jgi:hypothetical protein
MSFLAPFMLWGGLAASIPIALHFFFRSRYRTVPWAAMKFLLDSIEQTSRRLKLQELLLLCLRVALLVLLALALARPITSALRGSGGGDAVDAVFLVDTSLSMGASDGAKTRMERARAEALRIIDQLPQHSTVQIVTCAGTEATLLGPRSPANLDQARGLLQEIRPTDLATDLYPGLAEVATVLQRGQSSNKELYVFSDMQKSGWDRQAGGLAQLLQEIKEKTVVTLVRCGTRTLKNVSVVGITPQSGVPRPGERVGFAVLVRNTSTEPVQDLKVTLSIDGDEKALETQALDRIDPGETRALTLTGKLDKGGLRVLTARVTHDDLEGDNRYDQVIQVRDQVNILVVDGNYNEREPARSSSYWLTHALIPVDETQRSRFHLQPRYVTPRQASPALLQRQDLCILVNVPLKAKAGSGEPLPLDFVEELGRFVRQGHGLVIFAGENVAAEPYNRLLGQQQGLLPLPIKAAFKTDPAKPLSIDRNSFALPAFWKFKEDDYYKNFSEVEVWQGLELTEAAPAKEAERKEASPVTVVLRYNDGKPAVVSRKVDAGEVMLVTTSAEPGTDEKSPNPTWTNWPFLLNVHLPFIHVMVSHLLHGQAQSYNTVAGETLTWYPTERTPLAYTLIQPDGKRIRLGLPEKIGNRSVVTATDLAQAGVYHLTSAAPLASEPPESTASKELGTPLAIIPDLRECEDLQTLADPQLDERLGFTPLHIIAGAEASATSSSDRLNREWTLWLLTSVLIVLLAEGALAWWCGRAW